ncbi:hypothetical protein GCM10027347_52870 [Larkinella harenae]
MDILEKELEDMIWDAASTPEGREFLSYRGLDIEGKLLRQVPLGKYGIADLISVEFAGREMDFTEPRVLRNVLITVWELKRGIINTEAIMQAFRYLSAVKRIVNPERAYYDRRIHFSFRVRMAGSGLDHNTDLIYMLEHFRRQLSIFRYSFSYKGIDFDQVPLDGWGIQDPGFNRNLAHFSRSDLKSIFQELPSTLPF